jgi:hypothetical protein
MATRNVVPRATEEGNIGTDLKRWLKGWFKNLMVAGEFLLGDGTAGDKTITANNADTNKPKIRYNDTDNKWQYTNDGTTWKDIGSGGAKSYETTFTSSSLVGGVLTVTHNLNTKSISCAVRDNNDELIIPDKDDATGVNTVDIDLTSFGTISGTWRVVIFAYQAA